MAYTGSREVSFKFMKNVGVNSASLNALRKLIWKIFILKSAAVET
jgi:hypothetical protein